MKKILFLLLFSIVANVYAQESLLLRLKYNKGDRFLTQMDMKQTMADGVVETNTKTNVLNFVSDVKDGIYEVEQKVEYISSDTKTMMGISILYNSDMKESEMDSEVKVLHQKLKPMLNSVVLYYFDDLSDTKDVKVKSGDVDIASYKQNSTFINMPFPKEKVKVGYTWGNTVKNAMGVEMKKNYTITKIDENYVYVKVNGVISGVGEGNIEGEMILNKMNGLLQSSTSKSTMNVMGMETETVADITMKKL